MADVHVRAGGAGIADEADIGLGRAFRIDARHVGDVGEGRHAARGGKLAHGRQLLHAGARCVGVEDADADAAFVQPARDSLEYPRELRLAGDVLHPARIAHGAAERFERRFLVGAGHGTNAGKGPVGGGAVVEHAPERGLAPVPGCDRHHARLEVERRRHPVEGLHAVRGDRLAVRVQVDEAGSDDKPGGVDDPLGAAESRPHGGDPAIQQRHVARRIHPARRIHHPAAADHQAAHEDAPRTRRPARPDAAAARCVRAAWRQDQARSKRSRFITLFQAATKSWTNFFCESAEA